MLLAVDIGNSEIVFSCVENGLRKARFVLSSDKSRSPDEYSALIEILLTHAVIPLNTFNGSVIASVVPQLTGTITSAIRKCIGQKPLVVGPGVKNGLRIRMDDPTELGADLVAAAVAAVAKYPLPCAIINMGTATAIGVIDANGNYIGGLICPGISLSRTSLANATSQLPDVSLDGPKKTIGKSTKECLQSGIIFGTAAMIDGILKRIEKELGTPLSSVVATGDSALQILPYCENQKIQLNEDLVMEGLWSIWCKNKDGR